jgi:hypothetical protein
MPVARTNTSITDANATNDAYSVTGTFHVYFNPALTSNGCVRITQLFATGEAARALATNEGVASVFGDSVARIYLTKYSKTNSPSTAKNNTSTNH